MALVMSRSPPPALAGGDAALASMVTPPTNIHVGTTPPGNNVRPVSDSLLKALKRKSFSAVESLLMNEPFLVNVPLGGQRELPLHFALNCGCSTKILVLLLHHGAEVDALGKNGLTALATVVASAEDRKGPHTSTFPITSSPPWSPFSIQPFVNPVKADAFDAFANFLSQTQIAAPPVNLNLPLQAAVQTSFLHDADWLRGPAIEFLDVVQEEYQLKAAKCLLHHGADPHKKDDIGITALMYAKRSGGHQLVTLLEEFEDGKNVDLQFRMIAGASPLTPILTRHVYKFLLSDSFNKGSSALMSPTIHQ